jgi:hypothetical protein
MDNQKTISLPVISAIFSNYISHIFGPFKGQSSMLLLFLVAYHPESTGLA